MKTMAKLAYLSNYRRERLAAAVAAASFEAGSVWPILGRARRQALVSSV